MSSRRTQCPSCHATFPMPDAKLGKPNAKAKCGRCQHVFLLNDHLVPLPQPKPATKVGVNLDALNNISAEEPPIAVKHTKHTPIDDNVIFDDEPDERPNPSNVSFSERDLDKFLKQDIHANQPIRSTFDEKSADHEHGDEAWIKDLLNDDTPIKAGQFRPKSSHSQSGVDFDNFIPVAAPAPRKNNAVKKLLARKPPTTQELASQRSIVPQFFWLFGIVLLVALLGVQYVWFNTEEVAKNPTQADLVHSLCSKCAIPSADLSNLSVTHIHNNEDYTTNIVITLKNNGTQSQLYPNLLVTIKDVNGKLLGDFVATPKDYLTHDQKSLLPNQRNRTMLTVHTVKFASTIDIKPFY